MTSLEEVIGRYIPLGNRSSSGWVTLRCEVCNDHQHKKRGGFKFDQNNIGYNCFNCGATFQYDSDKPFVSDDMVRILRAYGIPDSEFSQFKLEALRVGNRGKPSLPSPDKPAIHWPVPISKPASFIDIREDDSIWSTVAKEYLESRNIDWQLDSYWINADDGTPFAKAWKARVILPVRNAQGALIFYQGRDLTGKADPKYLSSPTPRSNVLYGMRELNANRDDPLFIVEGIFDAQAVGGVAIFSNKPTKEQIAIINTSKRRKIYVPDKRGRGAVGAKIALRAGWEISIPDIGNCKDVSEAMDTYGSLYVKSSLLENSCSGFIADLKLKVFTSVQ